MLCLFVLYESRTEIFCAFGVRCCTQFVFSKIATIYFYITAGIVFIIQYRKAGGLFSTLWFSLTIELYGEY